jgi:hypothetical protein
MLHERYMLLQMKSLYETYVLLGYPEAAELKVKIKKYEKNLKRLEKWLATLPKDAND